MRNRKNNHRKTTNKLRLAKQAAFYCTKEGDNMTCTHSRIKSVNCVKFCADCGAKLPAGWGTDTNTSVEPEAVKTPVDGQKKTRKKVTK